MADKKKPIVFFDSFEEQEEYGLLSSVDMNIAERLRAMYKLNRRLYGARPKNLPKTTQLFVAEPGESVNEFYRRINGDD